MADKRVIALGCFDGVHRGHQAVGERAVEIARQLRAKAAIYSFSEHPSTLLEKTAQKSLLTQARKEQIFAQMGIEEQFYEEFQKVAQMDGETFAKRILKDRLSAVAVVVGADFRFGRDAAWDATSLVALGERYGFTTHIVPFVQLAGEKISSSRIRAALAAGDMETARACLGRAVTIEGAVVSGKGLARQWGTPTVNVVPQKELLLPRYGVYAGYIILNGHPFPAVTNVGVRPSFADGDTPNAESFVIEGTPPDCRRAVVELYEFIREEAHFSPQQLAAQIKADSRKAAEILQRKEQGANQ